VFCVNKDIVYAIYTRETQDESLVDTDHDDSDVEHTQNLTHQYEMQMNGGDPVQHHTHQSNEGTLLDHIIQQTIQQLTQTHTKVVSYLVSLRFLAVSLFSLASLSFLLSLVFYLFSLSLSLSPLILSYLFSLLPNLSCLSSSSSLCFLFSSLLSVLSLFSYFSYLYISLWDTNTKELRG